MASNVMKYPRYADRCRNSEKTKKLRCYVCPESLQDKIDIWDKHVTDPQHLSMIESFKKSFCETKLHVVCKLCSKSFAKWETVKHAISHQFSPWHKPKKLHFIFVRHFIAHITNKYYCHLCQEPFSFWHIALNHINDTKHQCLQKDKISEDIGDKLPISAPSCESLINHSVFPKNSSIFECMVCDRSFSGSKNFEEHIKGKGHRSHENKLADRLKNPVALEKQEAVNGGRVPIGKRKKKFKGKCGGSTGPQSTSSKKKKPKKSEQRQANKPSGAATPEINAKLLSNSTINHAEEMTLETSTSEASPSAHKSVLPNRQLGRVIHRPNKNKPRIPCRKCNEKVRDNVELHVHLTNHFWPRFIRYKDTEGDQLNASIDENVLHGLAMNDEDEIRCEENYPSVANVAPLEMSKLIKQLGNIQPFSAENGRNVADILNRMHQINETTHTHSIRPENEQRTISDHPKAEKLDPPMDTFKGISRLQFFENLSKQLAPDTKNAPDESNVINTATRLYELTPKTYNIEEISQKRRNPASARRIMKKAGDVQYSRSNNDYIYHIDNNQLEDIELSIILSFIRDKNNIYCLICRKNVTNSIQNVHEHLCDYKHNVYLKQMRQDQLKFITFPDSFSDLHLALHFMEETSDQYVQCWACEELIQNDSTILRQHIEIGEHWMKCKKFIEDSAKLLKLIKTRMTRDWYNVQYYWCVVCGIKSPSECDFVKHLKSMKHNKNCWKFQVVENLMFDFCPTCATMWLGFQCTFAYHCECKMHKYHARDSFYHITKLPNEAKKLLSNWPNITDEILRSIDEDSNIEKCKEEKIVSDLLEVAQEEFYRAKIYPFGSRISGLALKNSDFDVFIDCDNTYEKKNSLTKVKQCIKAIEGSLKNRSKTWKINRTVIDNVRVPIIKVYHRPTGIECDVSFTNGLSVENTQLIRNYIEMYPLCRNLIIFIKKWIIACDLIEPNGFTSYAAVWMVIYYLQKQDILPSVAELIRLKGKSKLVAGWETGVEKNPYVQDTRFSLIQLIQGFFETYSQFDYQRNVICPLMGESIEKKDFAKANLPDEMWPYMAYLATQTSSVTEIEKFCIDAAICVQDPFDLSRNLTKNVKKFIVHRLRVFCSMSAQMLQQHNRS